MKALLLGLLLFLLLPITAFAQEELQIDADSVTATVTPAPEIVYTLPYPGILPDHPLYGLKAARDRIVSFFISDPQKKAEFSLLQADKRVQAGLFLMHKEKPDMKLAITTISKGQNYFEEAIVAVTKAEEEAGEKQSLGDLPSKLQSAALQHHALLTKEAKNIPSTAQADFQLLVKRASVLSTETEKLQK